MPSPKIPGLHVGPLDPDVAAVSPQVDELVRAAFHQKVVAVAPESRPLDQERAPLRDVKAGRKIPRPRDVGSDGLRPLVEGVDGAWSVGSCLVDVPKRNAGSILQVPDWLMWMVGGVYDEKERSFFGGVGVSV